MSYGKRRSGSGYGSQRHSGHGAGIANKKLHKKIVNKLLAARVPTIDAMREVDKGGKSFKKVREQIDNSLAANTKAIIQTDMAFDD